MTRARNNQRGFSLIEVMIAAATIGVLSSVALTQYYSYIAKARRSEAYFGLGSIKTLENAFYVENNRFSASLITLDFGIPGGEPHSPTEYWGPVYDYNLAQPWGVHSYYAVATADLDGDPWPDELVTWDILAAPP